MIPRLPSLKLIAISGVALAVTGAVAWSSWNLATHFTEKRERMQADERVQEAIKNAQERYDIQQELTSHYRSLAEDQMSKMLLKLDNIKIEHVTITRNIMAERDSNPEFYNTPLPEGGLKEWESARQLLR